MVDRPGALSEHCPTVADVSRRPQRGAAVNATIFVTTVLLACAAAWLLVSARNRHSQARDTGHLPQLALSDSDRVHAQQIASTICAGCHGPQLAGGVGPSLNDIGHRRSADRIERIILHGKGRNKGVAMPSGLVSEADAALMAGWLVTQ